MRLGRVSKGNGQNLGKRHIIQRVGYTETCDIEDPLRLLPWSQLIITIYIYMRPT